jgi:nicotinamide phosphoribosyltransferase
LSKPATKEQVDQAEKTILAHGLPFYREGWDYILETYSGHLPLEIYALPEGIKVQPGVPLVTVVNTDPKCYWLTSFIETALLRAIWYPTTVASNSFATKKVIKKFLEETGDVSLLPFKLHDFGSRGVSSEESSAIGGYAHLVNFMGTDNVSALHFCSKFYGANMAGYSIPAMEHSTVTSWGRDHEVESYRNMLNLYAKPGSLVACVSDSYDIYNACKLWGTELKQQVIGSGATIVIRPDSGNPVEVVTEVALLLDQYFGSVINDKGYIVLNNVRIIQGDGITTESVSAILQSLKDHGFSADNIAFGQGGALLQQVNRDTCRFAMKCSAVMIDNEWVDVKKDPITDSGKRSKAGRFVVTRAAEDYGDNLQVDYLHDNQDISDIENSVLKVYYRNGSFNLTDLDTVRSLASI